MSQPKPTLRESLKTAVLPRVSDRLLIKLDGDEKAENNVSWREALPLIVDTTLEHIEYLMNREVEERVALLAQEIYNAAAASFTPWVVTSDGSANEASYIIAEVIRKELVAEIGEGEPDFASYAKVEDFLRK